MEKLACSPEICISFQERELGGNNTKKICPLSSLERRFIIAFNLVLLTYSTFFLQKTNENLEGHLLSLSPCNDQEKLFQIFFFFIYLNVNSKVKLPCDEFFKISNGFENEKALL